MRPNIEEIRERVNKATAGPWSADIYGNVSMQMPAKYKLTTTWGIPSNGQFVAHAREDVPALLAYIDELENMPLVQTVVKLQEENERLCEALTKIANPMKNGVMEWCLDQRKESGLDYTFDDWAPHIARQALEGANS